jgi:uridine kinase
MVLIGGPSKSGKTTLASVLKDIFQSLQHTTHIIPIDLYLKPKHERKETAGVLTRYNLDPLIETLEQLARNRNGTVLTPPTRQFHRSKTLSSGKITVAKNDILIVEGVPALLHQSLRDLFENRIYVEIPESIRRARVFEEYRSRNMSEKKIEELIRLRDIDEIAPILETKKYANQIIRLESDASDIK